ncbi:MAG TPA: hypothetical protein VF175_17685 [Lacipirellula sp.]
MFRFSLKWILAAMVYAAIAAAAFSQESWVYADLLCAASLLALGYAVMLIIYARGARQAASAGFAVFMLLLAVCMLVTPNSVPTQRILLAAGVGQPPILPTPTSPTPAPSATFAGSGAWNLVPNSGAATISNSPYSLSLAPPPTATFVSFPSEFDVTLKLRAANAVATMTCGLFGALLALVAYRRTRILAPPLASGARGEPRG